MNEPPGARARVALSALTVAEYFRDEEGQDVLLFVDNIFRFTQAGSEVSALLGRIPSAVGYQPTLSTEMGALQERITSTNKGSITACRPSTSPPTTSPTRPRRRPSPTSTRRPSRARDLRARHLPGRRSARLDVDACSIRRSSASTTTTSRAACSDAPEVQGPAGHHRHPRHGRALAKTTSSSCRAPARSSASSRSRSSSPRSSPASTGKFVPLKETIAGFKEILDGKLDDVPEQAFYLRRQHRRDEGEAAEQLKPLAADGRRQSHARDRHAARASRCATRSTRSPRRASRASSACCRGTCRCSRRCARASSRTTQGGEEKKLAVADGFVEVEDDRALLLTDKVATKDGSIRCACGSSSKRSTKSSTNYTDRPSRPNGRSSWRARLWAAAQLELYGDPPPATHRSFETFGPPAPPEEDQVDFPEPENDLEARVEQGLKR